MNKRPSWISFLDRVAFNHFIIKEGTSGYIYRLGQLLEFVLFRDKWKCILWASYTWYCVCELPGIKHNNVIGKPIRVFYLTGSSYIVSPAGLWPHAGLPRPALGPSTPHVRRVCLMDCSLNHDQPSLLSPRPVGHQPAYPAFPTATYCCCSSNASKACP